MNLDIPRRNIVDEPPDIKAADVSSLTIQLDKPELIQEIMEMSSLMDKGTFTVVDEQGPLYQFRAIPNVQFGTEPTRVVLSIHGPITLLRAQG